MIFSDLNVQAQNVFWPEPLGISICLFVTSVSFLGTIFGTCNLSTIFDPPFQSISNHNFTSLYCKSSMKTVQRYVQIHGLRTPGEENAFTARPKINSQSQVFRYGRSIFCLPHRPKFSDFFDLCLHLVSVVRAISQS